MALVLQAIELTLEQFAQELWSALSWREILGLETAEV